jgi:multiple sugar transport system substrate-binding protein
MVRKVMLAAAFALAGCGEEERRSLTFQVTGDPEETAVYEKLADAYEDADVKIVEVPERDVHLAKLTTALSAGRAPDVFLINYRNLGPFAARGTVDPVPEDFPRGGYHELPMRAFTFEGKLQCVPQNASSLAVYVNLDAFAKAGVEVPKQAWSYAEFLAAAEKVGVGFDPNLIRTAPWVWAAGGDLQPLDTPAARRGLKNMLRIARFAPSADEADAKGNDARFVDGELGMYLSSRRDVPLLRTIKKFAWDVAPFPRDREPASVLHSDGFCVSKGERAAAAHDFVAWALGPEGQEILAASGRTVPSLKSVAVTSPPENSQVFVDALEHMRRLPVTEDWTELEGKADDVLESLYYGKLELDEALERLSAETDGRF